MCEPFGLPLGLPLGPEFPSEGKHTALNSAYQLVLDCIQTSFDTNGKDAKRFLSDLRSTMICWGCDIRVETGSLESIRNTMFESVIRSTFDRMMAILQHYYGYRSSEYLALQTELEKCARRLESFVSPIRMSQVIKTGNGPLDGMRRKIAELSENARKQSDLAVRTISPPRVRKETYIIAPSNRPTIGLGSIITDPFDPEKQLLPMEERDKMKKPPLTVQINGKAARNKLLEGKAKIWQTYLDNLDTAGTRLASSGRSSTDTLIDQTKFESMESHYYKPNKADLSKALSNPTVRAFLNRPGSAPMYMITGVKVVRGVEGTDRGQQGASANVGVDAIPYGVPVMMGPDVAASSKRGQTSSSSETLSNFVYAYQVSEISRGHKIRGPQSLEFNKGSFFSAQEYDEESEISSWELRTPEIETLEEYGEDLKGTVLISTDDEC